MLAQLSRSVGTSASPSHEAETFGGETSVRRVALVAPRGLFRDGFAHLVAVYFDELRLECYDSVEDVVPGPARLGLLAADPGAFSRAALSAAIEAMRARCEGAPVGMVAPDDRAPAAAGLGALGVAGVVSLTAGAEVAAAAVRLMSLGGYCLPPEGAPTTTGAGAQDEAEAVTTASLAEGASAAGQRAGLRCDLTTRERDVLRCLRDGQQNKIIAHELGISESTVKVHLRNIMKKLNVSNRTQVALGGPVFIDRSGARVYGATARRHEFECGVAAPALVARRAEAEADTHPRV